MSDVEASHTLSEFISSLQSEAEKIEGELKEIDLLYEQSRIELDKLAKRNAQTASNLQRILGSFETIPREELRDAYENALDSQQRLFVMRGQVEKLQSEKQILNRLSSKLKEVIEYFKKAEIVSQPGSRDNRTVETIEMVINAQESERQRLSRQMHDGPAQALSNFILQADIAMRLFDIDVEKAKEELMNLRAAASKTFSQVRDFIFELRPMMLDDLGLIPTIKRYVEAASEQSGLPIELSATGSEVRLESYLEVMIFRAVQELVNNALHYSNASEVKVWLDIEANLARVAVEDNGSGFSWEEIAEKAGMGLKVIKERVEMIGGEFEVDSVVDQGTRISFQVPTN